MVSLVYSGNKAGRHDADHFKNQLNHFSDNFHNLSAKSNNVSTFGDYSCEHAISSGFPWID